MREIHATFFRQFLVIYLALKRQIMAECPLLPPCRTRDRREK